jgi:hypothetical protein
MFAGVDVRRSYRHTGITDPAGTLLVLCSCRLDWDFAASAPPPPSTPKSPEPARYQPTRLENLSLIVRGLHTGFAGATVGLIRQPGNDEISSKSALEAEAALRLHAAAACQ